MLGKHCILNPILNKAIICAVVATSPPLPNPLHYAFTCKPSEEPGPVGRLSLADDGCRGSGTPRSPPRPRGKESSAPSAPRGERPLSSRRRSAAPHLRRHQPLTGFLEPGVGRRLARLTRGRARIKSRARAPPPRPGAAMTRRPRTSAGALRHLRAHVSSGRCFTAAAPPLSYCPVRRAVCPCRAWSPESGLGRGAGKRGAWTRDLLLGVGS